MKKTSRKTIRRSRKQKRSDHAAGCRVNQQELDAINVDILELAALGGIKPSLGAYVKHATLSHARLRKLEATIRKLVADEAIASYFVAEFPGEGADAGCRFYDAVKDALGGGR